MPFIRPVVFGPLKIDVNDKSVKKAEFYVNGQLKNTIEKPPYIFKWNEKAFSKHNIETKIYDQNGKTSSSGEMSFYIFNSPRIFK